MLHKLRAHQSASENLQMKYADLMAKCKKAYPDWTEAQHKAWVEKEMSKPDVKEMGDLPGHPFRGNQWTGKSGAQDQKAVGRRANELVEEAIQSLDEGRSDSSVKDLLQKMLRDIPDSNESILGDLALPGSLKSVNEDQAAEAIVRAALQSVKNHEVKEMSHQNAVRGVEIFASGLHNGDQYSEQDIDDIIAAHKELDFRPAIKIGHSKDSPGAPAYGWVTALRKVGGKLVADFESMHDSVITALKDKRYDRVSSEIYFNLKRGGKQFRRALKAVALLGADVPAVAGLTPLHKMEFVADGFESVAACEQGLEIQKQSIIDSLTERVAALTEASETAELEDQVTELEDQVAEFGEGKWVTINGRHIQIKDGEDLEGAMKREGLSKKPGDVKGKIKKEPSAKKIIRSITGIKNAGTNISIELEHAGKDLATATKSDVLDAMQKAVERWKTAVSSGPDAKEPGMQRVGREYIDTYQKIISKVSQFSEEEQDAMTIKELQEKKAALEATLEKLKKTGGQSDEAKIAKFDEEITAFGEQIEALEASEATTAENAELKARLALTVAAERESSMERTGQSFGGIRPAPARFHRLWEKHSDA